MKLRPAIVSEIVLGTRRSAEFVCGPLRFKCQFITYFGAVGLL